MQVPKLWVGALSGSACTAGLRLTPVPAAQRNCVCERATDSAKVAGAANKPAEHSIGGKEDKAIGDHIRGREGRRDGDAGRKERKTCVVIH